MDELPFNNIGQRQESERELIRSVLEVPKKERVAKLLELGVLTNLEGYTWGNIFGNRFFVFANFQGIPVPMYKTLKHTGEKRTDLNFFAFFGITPDFEWVIKGDSKQNNEFYGIKGLESISRILTSVFNFDTSGYVPDGKEVLSSKELNELLERKFEIDFSELTKHSATYYLDKLVEIFFGEFKRKSSAQ